MMRASSSFATRRFSAQSHERSFKRADSPLYATLCGENGGGASNAVSRTARPTARSGRRAEDRDLQLPRYRRAVATFM